LEDAVPASRAIPELQFPVSGQWEPIVRGWLVADQLVHRKQRHTAKRMWERLVEEHDAQISASAVRAMVARLKVELRIGTVDVAIVQTHLGGVYQGSWTCCLLARGWVHVPEETEVFITVQGRGSSICDRNRLSTLTEKCTNFAR